MAEKKWYVVHTYSGFENKAKKSLEEKIKLEGLTDLSRSVAEIANGLGYEAIVAGRVEEGPRQVIVEPIDVVYATDELDLAPQS